MSTLEQATTRATRLLAPNPGPMTLEGTNTWVLREPAGDACVVVDPGPLDEGHLNRVAEHGPIDLIVLTHGHSDHAEGAGRLRELTGAPIVARDPSLCVDAQPLGGGAAQHAAGVEWLTIVTPGHSSDSVCLVVPADRALLTGDTILGRGTTVVAHPDGRLGDYLDSLRRLRDLAESDVDVLLPGHGPVLDAPLETLDYYLQHREERLEQVRAAMADGAADAADVVRRVYADVDPGLWPAAELSVRAQLEYLGGQAGP
ncbi:MAG TPA: MBL fold metallo-hydrolase [Mycobacteriales bacterium]|nr:MBL fold metallo-hydrolase [Mycobacteriales bacterium]HET7311641.1 MBL fold metallo-hydrolase [Mycobacteriales bacterium]